MKLWLFISFLGLVVLQTSCQDTGKQRVIDYLKLNYELKSKRVDNLGKRYFIPKGTNPPVAKIKARSLEHKTGYTFYKTVLNNILSVTPRSTVIIALPKIETASLYEIKSLYMMDTYSEFIIILEGVKFKNRKEKETAVKEIAKVASAFIVNGKSKNFHGENEEMKIEIWANDKLSNELMFSFVDDELHQITINDAPLIE